MLAEPAWGHEDIVVVHADPQLLVLDKPAGLLSVPGRGEHKQDCLSRRVQRHFADALVVHRLDMATSGLMLMARGAPSQSALGRAFAQAQVHKRYEAIVHGTPDASPSDQDGWHLIDLPIRADWPQRPRQAIGGAGAKPSRTRWRLEGATQLGTHLALEPLSGRSHQLRVHLLALGHPIVGDALYNPHPTPPGVTRLLLHASRLRLRHPGDGRALEFASAAPFLEPPAS